MDERQTQIREAAGLDESRLNTEFVEFLRKWGPIALGVLAVAALAFVGRNYLREQSGIRTDSAFLELESAQREGNPDVLLRVADTYARERGVPHLARLNAADVLFQSARAGVTPRVRAGAGMSVGGVVEDEADVLSAEQRAAQFRRAGDLYDRVARDTRADRFARLYTVRALFGQAAVAESLGNFDDARRIYDDLITVAESAAFADHADRARRLRDTIADYTDAPTLLAEADLPAPVLPTGAGAFPGGFDAAPFMPSLSPDGPMPMPMPIRVDSDGNTTIDFSGTGTTPAGDEPSGDEPSGDEPSSDEPE